MRRTFCPDSKKRKQNNGTVRYKPNPVKNMKLRKSQMKEEREKLLEEVYTIAS